jgi:hypothetical protein
MQTFPQCRASRFLNPGPTTARVKRSEGMLQILQEYRASHFDGTAAGDKSWFRHFLPYLKILTQSPAEIIRGRDMQSALSKL